MKGNDPNNWHGWPPQVWNGKRWVYIESIAGVQLPASSGGDVGSLKGDLGSRQSEGLSPRQDRQPPHQLELEILKQEKSNV
jgi:hypothetical protein